MGLKWGKIAVKISFLAGIEPNFSLQVSPRNLQSISKVQNFVFIELGAIEPKFKKIEKIEKLLVSRIVKIGAFWYIYVCSLQFSFSKNAKKPQNRAHQGVNVIPKPKNRGFCRPLAPLIPVWGSVFRRGRKIPENHPFCDIFAKSVFFTFFQNFFGFFRFPRAPSKKNFKLFRFCKK